jgi:hypothetical protein
MSKYTRDAPSSTVASPSPLSMRRRWIAHSPSVLRMLGVTPKSRQYHSHTEHQRGIQHGDEDPFTAASRGNGAGCDAGRSDAVSRRWIMLVAGRRVVHARCVRSASELKPIMHFRTLCNHDGERHQCPYNRNGKRRRAQTTDSTCARISQC